MKIKEISIQNFKGIHDLSVSFGQITKIKGKNAAGKTTIADAFSWLLFNMDSHGNTKFEIRPLNSDGEKIHNTDISVIAKLDIDGEEKELKKVQSEKWTKKRGHEDRVFEGNINSYEIDGYPKSEKEYAEFIGSIVDADVFKILTNPTYFTAMSWKDQREILMRFVADMSDVELARMDSDFEPLMDELGKAPSTDDIQKKYAKQVKELKAKQTEIPTRIDEISKQKICVDVAELELAKADYERQLADLENKSLNNDLKMLEDELLAAESSTMARKAAMRSELNKKRSEIENRIYQADKKVSDAETKLRTAKSLIADYEVDIKTFSAEKETLAERYRKIQKETFNGSIDFDESKWEKPSTVCSLCGQELPKDRADKIIAEYEEKKAAAKKKAEDDYNRAKDDFNADKQKRLNDISDKGMKVKAGIEERTKAIEDAKASISGLEENLSAFSKEVETIKAELIGLGNEPDYDADNDYQSLMAKENELREKLSASVPKAENDTDDKRREVSVQLDEVKAKLAQAANNISIDERIAELETEQRETEQKIANAEKILYLLEKFIRAKLNRISEAVNSHFEKVRFRLFEVQINGGIKETCEAEVNGVPYNSLNSGHRIIAGLDIIKALSALYGVDVPIFLDNAESLSEGNLPTMTQQITLLEVSNDASLVVNGGA